jgi:competence protein ComGC
MRNSGMTFIGILFSLLFIALLTIMLLKNVGFNTSDSKKVKAPIEKAKAVECTLKVEALNNEVKIYKMSHENFPSSLDEIASDTTCPVSGVQLDYNQTTGKVRCPEHG